MRSSHVAPLFLMALPLGAQTPKGAEPAPSPAPAPPSNATAPALEPGQAAPAFSAKDVAGQAVSLADFKGRIVVLEWTNPGCPFVKRHYEAGSLQALQAKAKAMGAVWIVVNSTNPAHKDHLTDAAFAQAMEAWKSAATHLVRDPEGKLGHAYGAKTTPHLFVLDPKGHLAYLGGVDDDPRGTKPERIAYLAQALDALAKGARPDPARTAPYGCSVKYAE